MIAIVDYGVGNLFSLLSSLRALDLEAEVTGDAGRLRAADRIILPGVGAFGDARAKLDATGLVPVIQEEAETNNFFRTYFRRLIKSNRVVKPRSCNHSRLVILHIPKRTVHDIADAVNHSHL